MGAYAAEHASAYADVAEAGAAVSFVGDTTVPAVVMRVDGNPIKYAELGLKLTESPTLFAVTVTYGDAVPDGATVPFGGITYYVVSIDPFDPDGQGAIYSRVIVSR